MEADPGGVWAIEDGLAIPKGKDEASPRYTTHFATCTNPSRFRR